MSALINVTNSRKNIVAIDLNSNSLTDYNPQPSKPIGKLAVYENYLFAAAASATSGSPESFYVFSIPQSTLPLTLTSFTAKNVNCQQLIEWNTVGEYDVDHFEVEQSFDGVTFNAVKTLAPQNTKENNSYAVTLSSKANTLYYRLKMVDMDGKTTYSDVATILANCETKIQSNAAAISISALTPGVYYLLITDSNNQTQREKFIKQ